MKSSLPPKVVYTVATAAYVADTSETNVWDTIRRGEVPTFLHGRKRAMLAEVWHEHLRKVAVDQADAKSSIGVAGRAAMADRRERMAEAKIAAEAATKPARRKARVRPSSN